MGLAVVKMKLMPTSPDVDLEEIKTKVQKIIEDQEGKGTKIELEPIAFGLNAVIAMFGWDEEKDLSPLENTLKDIENVNSVEMIDMRRAI